MHAPYLSTPRNSGAFSNVVDFGDASPRISAAACGLPLQREVAAQRAGILEGLAVFGYPSRFSPPGAFSVRCFACSSSGL
jgi:hypothetical protein